MKKILLSSLLLIQIVIFLIIPLQHDLIKTYGKSFTLVSEDYPNSNRYDIDYGPLYINLEINYLSDTLWNLEEDLKWGTRVFVVISPDESGIYHTKKVSLKKPEVEEEDILLLAQYQYSNEIEGYHYVEYGFERIENGYDLYDIDQRKQWLITVEKAPWGQIIVNYIENL